MKIPSKNNPTQGATPTAPTTQTTQTTSTTTQTPTPADLFQRTPPGSTPATTTPTTAPRGSSAHALRAGGAVDLRGQLITTLQRLDLGPALLEKPELAGRTAVLVRDDGPVDGTRQIAWLDASHTNFFVAVDGGGRQASQLGERFFGPFALEGQAQTKALPETPSAGDDGGMVQTMAVPENPASDDVAQTKALPETPGHDDGRAYTMAVPENPGSDGFAQTKALPETPGDDGGMMQTMAVPENPGSDG
jgi:hypothetical protein